MENFTFNINRNSTSHESIYTSEYFNCLNQLNEEKNIRISLLREISILRGRKHNNTKRYHNNKGTMTNIEHSCRESDYLFTIKAILKCLIKYYTSTTRLDEKKNINILSNEIQTAINANSIISDVQVRSLLTSLVSVMAIKSVDSPTEFNSPPIMHTTYSSNSSRFSLEDKSAMTIQKIYRGYRVRSLFALQYLV